VRMPKVKGKFHLFYGLPLVRTFNVQTNC